MTIIRAHQVRFRSRSTRFTLSHASHLNLSAAIILGQRSLVGVGDTHCPALLRSSLWVFADNRQRDTLRIVVQAPLRIRRLARSGKDGPPKSASFLLRPCNPWVSGGTSRIYVTWQPVHSFVPLAKCSIIGNMAELSLFRSYISWASLPSILLALVSLVRGLCFPRGIRH